MVAGPLARPATIALALLMLAAAVKGETTLDVYTAIEPEQLEEYARRFNREHPDIRIRWTRESTGVITERLLAERLEPRADVIWGLAATSMLLLQDEGLLHPYAPPGLERLHRRFRDAEQVPSWVGMSAWVGAICVNTVELRHKKIPVPTAWRDLAMPVYAGQVAMPNPASSGTGFLHVSSWLQRFGESSGWAFMDALHGNITHYTHSGSAPCTEAARGEVPIGISYAFRGARAKAAGAPLEIVIPSEGIGWELEAAAIVKGTGDLAAAQKLVDFAVSEQANHMYNESYAVVAIPGLAKPVEHFPEDVLTPMIQNDFQWAATNRERILFEWSTRYDAKTQKKKKKGD